MSLDERRALEAAQVRLRALERELATSESLTNLAFTLRREADALEAALGVGERRAARSTVDPGTRLAAFGFMVLFVMPIVGMLGFTAGETLRNHQAVAVLSLLAGVLALAFVLSTRARAGVVHRLSAEWRLIREARRAADALEAPVRES
jgi:hypothetical protein